MWVLVFIYLVLFFVGYGLLASHQFDTGELSRPYWLIPDRQVKLSYRRRGAMERGQNYTSLIDTQRLKWKQAKFA